VQAVLPDQRRFLPGKGYDDQLHLERTRPDSRDRDRLLQYVDLHRDFHAHKCPHTQHGLYGDDHDRGQGCRR
jgi:hypothetical protein